MATYLDASFDKRLSRVEEQIKQFKTSQGYGMRQIQTYETPPLTFTSTVKSFSQEGETIRISVVECRLLFTGIYHSGTVVGKLKLTTFQDAGFDTRNLFYYGTNNPNELIIDYTSYGESAFPGEPDPPSFSETMTILTNMPGAVANL